MLAFDNHKLRHFSIKTITVPLVQFEIFKFADIFFFFLLLMSLQLNYNNSHFFVNALQL